jgi:hypothetical protein
MTVIPADDLLAVHQLLALYGHIVDDQEWGRLDEIFTGDGVFDITAFGAARLQGLEAIATYFAMHDQPLSHHTGNIVVETAAPDHLRARSKFFGPDPQGLMGVGVYDDVIVPTPTGWRIRERIARPRGRDLRGRTWPDPRAPRSA